jgi:hypothetical protein
MDLLSLGRFFAHEASPHPRSRICMSPYPMEMIDAAPDTSARKAGAELETP